MPASSGCAPSSSSITTPSSAPMRRLDLEQAQHDGLVGAEQLPARDAVHERVADLARGAGDGDVDGVRACAEITRRAHVGRSDTSSSTSRASVSSAMRSAAPRCTAPWSGCASRTRRRNRRCTSSRSTAMSAGSPSTSIAHRRSDGTPGPRTRSTDPARTPGAGGRTPGDPLDGAGRRRGPRAAPRAEHGRVDGPERDRRGRTAAGRRRRHAAPRSPATPAARGGRAPGGAAPSPARRRRSRIRCRDRSSPCVSVCRRYRNAMRGTVSPFGASWTKRPERVVLLLVEPGHVLGDHRAEQHARRTRHRWWAGRRRRARRVGSACAGACGGCSARRAARCPRLVDSTPASRLRHASAVSGRLSRADADQMASMIALNVALGRMAAVTSSSSGK